MLTELLTVGAPLNHSNITSNVTKLPHCIRLTTSSNAHEHLQYLCLLIQTKMLISPLFINLQNHAMQKYVCSTPECFHYIFLGTYMNGFYALLYAHPFPL